MLDKTRKAIGGPLGKITGGHQLTPGTIDTRYELLPVSWTRR